METHSSPTRSPTITGPPQGQWRYADWEAIPEDGNRYEVIDGVLYMTTAPTSFHQWILKRLERFLGIPAEDQNLAYTFFAPIGVLMPGCQPVQPDFVVVRTAQAHIIGQRIVGVPDLIIEVLSPHNQAYDQYTKRQAYARAGLPEYAIINPMERTLAHYRLQATGSYAPPDIYPESATVTFDCLPTLTIAIARLFEGAPDAHA
jgi:Uma2 family endonuclease